MKISISICPTNLEIGGDLLDEELYLSKIREVVIARWPTAKITTLQIGYRQGDEWFTFDGCESDELQTLVSEIDTSDETLYIARAALALAKEV